MKIKIKPKKIFEKIIDFLAEHNNLVMFFIVLLVNIVIWIILPKLIASWFTALSFTLLPATSIYMDSDKEAAFVIFPVAYILMSLIATFLIDYNYKDVTGEKLNPTIIEQTLILTDDNGKVLFNKDLGKPILHYTNNSKYNFYRVKYTYRNYWSTNKYKYEFRYLYGDDETLYIP